MDGAIGHKRFEELVKEHHASLRVFVRSLGVAADWVDDLAQDAFVEAYRKLDTFDVNRDFGKWLRGIARNLVRNELRKENRHRRILHEGLTQHLLDLLEEEEGGEVDHLVLAEVLLHALPVLLPDGEVQQLRQGLEELRGGRGVDLRFSELVVV